MYNVNKVKEKKVSLRELRTKLGLNQTQLAELIGTDQSELSRIERGQKIPEWYERMLKVSALLERAGLSFDDLILALPDSDYEGRAIASEDKTDYDPE